MKKLLYGAAYYDEYIPSALDRLEKDIAMMKDAGINVVRIAESTWSTLEPQDGVFDFTSIDRVLSAMDKNGIGVIIGTPTYAVPTWMTKSYPEILETTRTGKAIYGARQIMDITHPVYLFYAERIIRKLMERVTLSSCVIGYQLDNETKYYDNASPNVQQRFIKYLRAKFNDDLDLLNEEFGLAYWSNRINSWEDFPDVRGTINGSLAGEFDKFRRTLVDEFLAWQAAIVQEYRQPHQFVTQNLDFDWRGHSFGLQPSVNHFHAAKCLTIAGCDIYHPSQKNLTGEEIAFGGDLTRSVKMDNYLVIETQAQGQLGWLPFKGQLRLQAYSHLASGANSVMYWHWHSIHNSIETYWKGLLSHDFAENDTYLEAKTIGTEWEALGEKLVNLKKKNKIAIMVSNESLTALNWFRVETGMPYGSEFGYNDILRWMYNQFYRLNAECDFISPESTHLERYTLIAAPALYAVPEETLHRLDSFVKNGGHLVTTFRSAVANENVKVYHDTQPHILHKCLGITYNQFTKPEDTLLSSAEYNVPDAERDARVFMELLKPQGAAVMASYEHYNWGEYAAVTQNRYGAGMATHIGCFTSDTYLREILADCLKKAGLWTPVQEITFPVIVRRGTNDFGKEIVYYLNYSKDRQTVSYTGKGGTELRRNTSLKGGDNLVLEPWDAAIVEE